MMYRILIAVFIFAVTLLPKASAIAPQYISDTELANSPIIVVARWSKATILSTNEPTTAKDQSPVVTIIRTNTTLEVLRSIKGDIKPGRYPLMFGWSVGWQEDGTGINSATSTEVQGDAADVTVSNIWFLKLERSENKGDKESNLFINNYRSVQPLSLEPYFDALMTAHPEQEVPKLLTAKDTQVINRALRYLTGEYLPWPYDSDFDRPGEFKPSQRGMVLHGEAETVIGVIRQESLKDQRAMALAVYAELAGTKSRPFIQSLLIDKDSMVRGMAVALLCRDQDASSIPQMIEAINGVTNGWLACKIIETIQNWNDIRIVPVLIHFLQNDNSVGRIGDDLLIPAIKARTALKNLTGYVFPYDVDASKAAWNKTAHLSDSKQRNQRLSELIPCEALPVTLEIIGSRENALLRLRNTSAQAVTITKRPSDYEFSTPNFSSNASVGNSFDGTNKFQTLQPQEQITFPYQLDASFLNSSPATRSLQVTYDRTGSELGIKAWIGLVPVRFGPEWKEAGK